MNGSVLAWSPCFPKPSAWAGRSLLKGRLSQQDPQHWVALDGERGLGRARRLWCWAVPQTHLLTQGLHLGSCPGLGVRGGWDVWAWPGLIRTKVGDGPLRDEVARLSDLSRATWDNGAWAGTCLCWPGGQGSGPRSSLRGSHRLHLGFSSIFSCGVLFCRNPHRGPCGPQGKQQLP